MTGLATRIGRRLQEPFTQGFLLLLLLITLFLSKPIFTGQPLLAADLLFSIDPLWRPLAPAGYDGPSNQLLSDQVFEFYPWQKFIRLELAQGRIPLWNPYVNSGHPLLANAQSALFDPFNVIALLWPLAQSFVVVAFLRLLCAGSFTLLLALELGLSRYAAFLAMIVFTFAAPQIVWLIYPKASVLVWFPAILFLSLRLIRTGKWRNVGWLALAMAVLLVGGHPETALYGLLLWFCFSGYWLWLQYSNDAQRLRRALLQLGVAGLLGLGVAAIQWLPVIEALWQSETLSARSHAALTWQSIFFQWHEWMAALTMLMPDFFGNPRHHSYWYPYDNYNEQTLFVGVLPLALAFLVFLKGKGPKEKEQPVAFFMVLAVISLGLALSLPGFTLLAEIPGLNVTNTGRMRGIYILAVALLAGYGLDLVRQSWVKAEEKRPSHQLLTRVLLLLGIGAASIALASYLFVTLFQSQLVEMGRAQALATTGNPFSIRSLEEYMQLAVVKVEQMATSFHPTNWRMYLPLILALIVLVGGVVVQRGSRNAALRAQLFSILIVVLVVGELWLVGLDYNPTIAPELAYPTPELVEFLAHESQPEGNAPYRIMGTGVALVPNLSMVFGLEDIRGYDPIASRRYMEVLTHLPGAFRVGHHLVFTEATAPLFDFLNVRYAFASEALAGRWRPLQESGGVTLYANSQAMPRAFMVYTGQSASTPEESLEMTLAPDFDFRNQVVLEGVDEPLVQLPPSLAARVVMTNAIAGEMSIQVETALPGYLVMSDPYTTGWVAEIDGEAAQLLIANHAFRGLAVPAGAHTVTLHYEPLSFVIGAWISVISLLFLFLIMIFGGRKPDGSATE